MQGVKKRAEKANTFSTLFFMVVVRMNSNDKTAHMKCAVSINLEINAIKNASQEPSPTCTNLHSFLDP